MRWDGYARMAQWKRGSLGAGVESGDRSSEARACLEAAEHQRQRFTGERLPSPPGAPVRSADALGAAGSLAEQARRRARRILVVDDDPGFRGVMREYLAGHRG